MSARARVLSEIVPDTTERVLIGDADVREWVARRYARRDAAYVRLNMITTPTGSAVGADGTSETITSRVDRLILGCIRADADAVVVGARTVRAEGYVVPRESALVIVTSTGDLSGHRLADADRDRVLLLCPVSAGERVRAASPGLEVVTVPDGEGLDPEAIVATLSEHGLRRLVCEGGPTLASRFVDAGVLDELCVTVAPVIEPAGHPFVRVARRPDTEVAGLLVDDAGFSYLRLRVSPRDPSRASSG